MPDEDTAGAGRGRFDYMSEGGNLPRIGSQSLASRDQFGQLMGQPGVYQTLTSANKAGTANPGRRMPIIRQAEALDENRIVLYKKGKQLGQGYYIVEISSNNTHLFIAAYDVESPESLLIELPEKRATDILKEFENDYESMANSLQVMNKRLVLLNPVSIIECTLLSKLTLFWCRNSCRREVEQHRREPVDLLALTCKETWKAKR